MDMTHVVTIVTVVFASSGFWQYISLKWEKKHSKRTNDQKLLMGIAYSKIVEMCHKHIEAGEIEADEYKELNQYLFEPYKAIGGNGTAARLINEVEKLPIKKEVVAK